MTRHLIDDVVTYARATGRSPLPDAALDAVSMLTFDGFGVGIAGASTPESVTALNVAKTWGTGDDAKVWGSGERLPAGSAAMVNAQQMHCLEFDSIHEGAVVHPMTVVLPVLSAFVQRAAAQGISYSGEDFLRAVTVGVDIAAGLGDATTTPLQFFRPGTAGSMGAVAALTALTQTDHEQAVGAFGVAYGSLCGTMQAHREGAQVLALQVGFNARGALNSWDLAANGFRGPREILEGPFGYFRLIEADGDPAGFVAQLGSPHEVEVTSVKPFPSGRATHGALSAMLALRAEHGFSLPEVERVEVQVPSMVKMLVGRDASMQLTPGSARLCLPYLIPIIVERGTLDLSAYSPESLENRTYLDFADSVEVTADDNPDPNAFNPQTITVFLKDGTVHSRRQDVSLGSPEMPMSAEQFAAKFSSNLLAAGRAVDEQGLRQALDELALTADVAQVVDQL